MQPQQEFEFLFLKGPVDIRQLYPEMVKASPLVYSEPSEINFVIFRGNKIKVSYWEEIGWRTSEIVYTDPISKEILFRTNLPETDVLFLPVLTEFVEREKLWSPEETIQNDEWMALMVTHNIIVGYYRGFIFCDEFGRDYSSFSFLNIRPDYRGRGLCRPFAQFAYGALTEKFRVNYICLTIATQHEIGVCKCYVRAAKNLGFRVYGDDDANFPNPKEIGVEECNSGKFVFLILVTQGDILDQEMITSFSE
ncbi:hypothetical protein pv_144 [Pithovirus sibericum]|uniref:N-acetyltransferase domain-containing protein n=1 Tax=Pithovirus sibericum TaxID=1450746 RepID=W5S4R7_9VIRU|nr:hypothetical protein pv_144 [Pithovirus sibericum]AHH01711.1 hypothetical protein pv_144 [Pithovirus sibericum]